MSHDTSLMWFRQDLRLSDNPALRAAATFGKVWPIYILDLSMPKPFQLGSASQIWLHHSLKKLEGSLSNRMTFYAGTPEKILQALLKTSKVTGLFWNACLEPWARAQDDHIKDMAEALGVKCHIFQGSYLWHPEDVLKEDGTPYKVFTAYKNKVSSLPLRAPLPKPEHLDVIKDVSKEGPPEQSLEALGLIPPHPWHKKIEAQWSFGEVAAQKKLDDFIDQKLLGYKKGRDYPSYDQTSKLSPHLHFGELSPSQVWEAVGLEASRSAGDLETQDLDKGHFLSEILWREFSGALLYHFPQLPTAPLQPLFQAFPWQDTSTFLKAWQKGETGYPFVDAGMRELWQTGYMHNRVRMVVASFLVKNLRIHWHKGRDWFWECLVDADLGNNSASWQWVAGCGADAAPYFRVFNPVLQGEKFDRQGVYTRKFVPELAHLPDTFLFKPWTAPETVLKKAGIVLGTTYPRPLVDLASSRLEALEAYKYLKTLAPERRISNKDRHSV